MSSKLFYEDEYEDEYDALNAMIVNSDLSYKKVALHLFPYLKPESAYARLKACLNSEKDERLTVEQALEICKLCARHDLLMYMCDRLGLTRPVRKVPEEEQGVLVQKIDAAAATLSKAMEQLERMRSRGVIQ